VVAAKRPGEVEAVSLAAPALSYAAMAALTQRFAQLSPTARGALWMVFAAFGFSASAGLIRHMSETLHVFEIAFFRNVFGLLYMSSWVATNGLGVLRTRRPGLYALRSVSALVAMLTWFTALAHLPLADAMALSFTTPIFTAVMAIFILAEVVRLRRWIAILLGFVGMLVIVRPGTSAFEPASLVALVSAASFASSAIMVKVLTRTEHPNAIMTYMVLVLVPASALVVTLAPLVGLGPGWQSVGWADLLWLAGIGAGTTVGHMGLTRAYAAADATAVQPFLYVQLPLVACVGYFAFGQAPTVYTWIGAALIATACLDLVRRESRRKT
jgi:drug/metabolite transporter (DMT)-like permease